MPIQKIDEISDTVSVTPDGGTIVDIGKLLSKEHMQKMIREMRSKTRIVSVRHNRSGERIIDRTDSRLPER